MRCLWGVAGDLNTCSEIGLSSNKVLAKNMKILISKVLDFLLEKRVTFYTATD
jgi:hypothetical protein